MMMKKISKKNDFTKGMEIESDGYITLDKGANKMIETTEQKIAWLKEAIAELEAQRDC